MNNTTPKLMTGTETTATHDGRPRCNSRKRGMTDRPKMDSGSWGGTGYCQQPAGWGTDHVGQGRCKLHGGSIPVRHGRYSKRLRSTLGDRIQELAADPDLLDLSEELATSRALLERALEKLEEEELDVEAATRIVAEVTRIAKRIEDIRAQNALSIKELQRIMAEMGRSVALRVEDPSTLEAIREDWSSIRL